MKAPLISELLKRPGTQTFAGATNELLAMFKEHVGWSLPPDHEAFLRQSNGLTWFDGYERLFGVLTSNELDSVRWNALETWKFAWLMQESHITDYWCFAANAVGCQYAYRVADLKKGNATPVYELFFSGMAPEQVAESFSDYCRTFLLKDQVVYSLLAKAKLRFSKVTLDSFLIHAPPFMFLTDDGDKTPHLQVMNSRTAMIFNGDVRDQAFNPIVGDDWEPALVIPFVDKQKRARLSVDWLTPDGERVHTKPRNCLD